MKKRIVVSELQLGMRILELDRPWLETPLPYPGFEIGSQAELDMLRTYCKQVYIETTSTSEETLLHAPGPGHKAIEMELLKKYSAPRHAQLYQDETSLEEEITTVTGTYQQAASLINEILADVRLGKSLDSRTVKATVGEMTASIVRNPDALLCFNQLKNKDSYLAEHGLRTCVLALAFGRHLGLSHTSLETLGLGALLHDIGMTTLPDELINKARPYNEQELRQIQQHVEAGVKILQTMEIPARAIDLARNHHERYNGSGYRLGLKGSAIGQFGLIGGIVDFYDEMTSDHHGIQGRSPQSVLRQIYKTKGIWFDPQLVENFIQCIGVYPIGSIVELNTGDVGVVVALNRIHRLKPKIALALRPDNKPHQTHRIVDLVTDRSDSGLAFEIDAAAEVGTYGINPADFVPLILPSPNQRLNTRRQLKPRAFTAISNPRAFDLAE